MKRWPGNVFCSLFHMLADLYFMESKLCICYETFVFVYLFLKRRLSFAFAVRRRDLCFFSKYQGHSQNLKAVTRNFMEVFIVDDVTVNDVIQKKKHLLRKEKLQISHSNHYCLISIFSIKLLKKTRNLVFISKGITSQFQYFLD